MAQNENFEIWSCLPSAYYPLFRENEGPLADNRHQMGYTQRPHLCSRQSAFFWIRVVAAHYQYKCMTIRLRYEWASKVVLDFLGTAPGRKHS